jgi:hypothetical protein
MLSSECLNELQSTWLPNITDDGLEHLINLLEKGSPLLVHGCFTRSVPMGCLATHVGWHHPATEHLTLDAGITWLHRVAGLNPATSHVIREWDRRGAHDYTIRCDLLAVLKEYRHGRSKVAAPSSRVRPQEPVEV